MQFLPGLQHCDFKLEKKRERKTIQENNTNSLWLKSTRTTKTQKLTSSLVHIPLGYVDAVPELPLIYTIKTFVPNWPQGNLYRELGNFVYFPLNNLLRLIAHPHLLVRGHQWEPLVANSASTHSRCGWAIVVSNNLNSCWLPKYTYIHLHNSWLHILPLHLKLEYNIKFDYPMLRIRWPICSNLTPTLKIQANGGNRALASTTAHSNRPR